MQAAMPFFTFGKIWTSGYTDRMIAVWKGGSSSYNDQDNLLPSPFPFL